jgi:hypothetical protein
LIYKRAAWLDAIQGMPAHPQTVNIPGLLDLFHASPVRTQQRRDTLADLAAICASLLAEPAFRHHAQFGPVYVLSAGVRKLLRSLGALDDHVNYNWGVAGTHNPALHAVTDPAEITRLRAHGLAPVNNAGRNRTVQEAKVGRNLVNAWLAHTGQVGLRHNYWLEAADPLHRYWGGAPDAADKLFELWMNSTQQDDFFTWIDYYKDALAADPRFNDPDLVDLLYAERGVRYMTSEERYRYRVKFDPATKLATRRDPKAAVHRDQKRFEVFSTRGLSTAFSGEHMAIWVCSNTNDSKTGKHKFYSHSHKVGRLHHSSFMEGRDVYGAGEWAVARGQILLITHKTGHYQAGWDELENVLKLLDKIHDLRDTMCCWTDYVNGEVRNYYWAWDVVHRVPPAPLYPIAEIPKGDDDPIARENLAMVAREELGTGRRAAWYKSRNLTPSDQPMAPAGRRRALGLGQAELQAWKRPVDAAPGKRVDWKVAQPRVRRPPV